METEDGREKDRIDREIHIEHLKHEAEKMAGGEMIHSESEDCPPELEELFWENVVRFEQGPFVTLFEQLENSGYELPPPDHLDDESITSTLWKLIQKLEELKVYITNTNHLNDRELYWHLWEISLREECPVMPLAGRAAWCIDILGGCSEEDISLHMKYYADETEREDWMKQFPDYEMLPHEDLPFDRDRHLPQMPYGRSEWDDEDEDDENDAPWDDEE